MIDDIVSRITDYLTNGGVFNPEMMPQGPACDLLIDCRDEIERLQAQVAALREARDECLAVIDFAMKVEDYNERDAFLRGWNEGDTSEWPEFRAALEEK